jgi:hypothetical protein
MQRLECQGKRLASSLNLQDLQVSFIDPSTVYPYICMIEPSGVVAFVKAIACLPETIEGYKGGYVAAVQPVGGGHQSLESVQKMTAEAKISIREDIQRSTMLIATLQVYAEGGNYVDNSKANHYVLAIAVREGTRGDWALWVLDPSGRITSRASLTIVFNVMRKALPELRLWHAYKVSGLDLTVVNKLYEYRGGGVCFMGPCTDLRMLIELWANSKVKAESGVDFVRRGREMLFRMRYTRKIHPTTRLVNLISPHLHPDDRKRDLKYIFNVKTPTENFDQLNPDHFAGAKFGHVHPDKWKRRVQEEMDALDERNVKRKLV